jgi:outer membrane protein insertion porin family
MSACAVNVRATANPRNPASPQQEGQDTCGGSGARPTLVRRAGDAGVQPPETRRETDGNDAGGDKATVKFEGLKTFSEKDVLNVLRQKGAGVCESFDYDPAKVEHAVRILKEYLAARGFLHATVDVREELGVTPKVITFVVNEGERAHIAEIRFEGNKFVPSGKLVEKVQACLDRSTDSRKEEKGMYDADRFDYCSRSTVPRLLSSEGYLQAEVDKPRTEEAKYGIIIIVPVNEGLRYRLGKIKIEGAAVFLPAQIVEMLDVKRGEVAEGEKFRNWLERLWDEYADRGYIGLYYDIEPVYKSAVKKPGEGIVDLDVYVEEGKPFTVGSITFKGNTLKTDGELKSILSLREGDLFNNRKFLDGLERLHQMGLFHGFIKGHIGGSGTFDSINYELDEDKGSISLTIYITDEGL